MNSKRKCLGYLSLPTAALDGEVWTHCHLRLTLQFQARHGIGVDIGDLARRTHRTDLDEVLDHRIGRAIHDAMLKLTVEDEFQDEYLEQLRDLNHLEPEQARLLAFNLAMDRYWDRIERTVQSYCESEATLNEELLDA